MASMKLCFPPGHKENLSQKRQPNDTKRIDNGTNLWYNIHEVYYNECLSFACLEQIRITEVHENCIIKSVAFMVTFAKQKHFVLIIRL